MPLSQNTAQLLSTGLRRPSAAHSVWKRFFHILSVQFCQIIGLESPLHSSRELSPPTSESSSPVSTVKPPLNVAGRARDFLLNLLLLLSKSHLRQPVISFHTAHSLI